MYRLDILPISSIESVRVIISDPNSKKSCPQYWCPLNEDFVPYNEHFPEGFRYTLDANHDNNTPFSSVTVPAHPCDLFRSKSRSATAERELHIQIQNSIRELQEDSDIDTDDQDEE